MSKEEAIKLSEAIREHIGKLLASVVILATDKGKKRLAPKIRKARMQEVESSGKAACRIWFDELQPVLVDLGLNRNIISKYDNAFSQLITKLPLLPYDIELGQPFFKLLFSFPLELTPLIYTMQKPPIKLKPLEEMIENAIDNEREYLLEASGCFRYGFIRASVVLGWSAAIHRVHRTLTKIGLEQFNKASLEMRKLQKGRFRRFNKEFRVKSMDELSATVFDTDLLWVMEYLELISKNQHDRLAACYMIRCDAAHPSNAMITEENVASFYSDLNEIIFKNSRFAS